MNVSTGHCVMMPIKSSFMCPSAEDLDIPGVDPGWFLEIGQNFVLIARE